MILPFILATAVAPQPNFAMFGIEMFRPLALPECARVKSQFGGMTPVVPASGPCWSKYGSDETGAEILTGRITIHFSWETFPTILSGPSLEAFILDGNIEFIKFETKGYKYSQSITAQLTSKFGKPFRISHGKAQNGFGAVYDAAVLTWHPVKSAFVEYNVIDENLNEGLVIASSDKGFAKYKDLYVPKDNSIPM